MIQQHERNRLAQLLEQILSGHVSYYEFASFTFDEAEDRGVAQIALHLNDLLYNDLAPRKPIALNHVESDVIQRCILFLKTDIEYMWPDCPEIDRKIELNILLLTLIDFILIIACRQLILLLWFFLIHGAFLVALQWFLERQLQKNIDRWSKFADITAWPFLTHLELRVRGKEKGAS